MLNIFQKLSSWIFLLAIVTSFYYQNLGGKDTSGNEALLAVPYRYEFAIMLSIGILAIVLLVKFLISENSSIKISKIVVFQFYWVTVVVTSTVVALFKYNLDFTSLGTVILVKLVFGLLVGIQCYYYIITYGMQFLRKIVICYSILSIFNLILLIFVKFINPEVGTLLSVLGVTNTGHDLQDRFAGLTSNPYQVSSQSYLSIFATIVLYRQRFINPNISISSIALRITVILYILGLFYMIYCTGNRIALLQVPLILIPIYASPLLKSRFWISRIILTRIAIQVFSFIIGLAIIAVTANLAMTKVANTVDDSSNIVSRLSSSDDRLNVWGYYAGIFPVDLTGYGVNYEETYGYPNSNPNQIRNLGPHNFILESLTVGGLTGLSIVLILYYKILLYISHAILNCKNNKSYPAGYFFAVYFFTTSALSILLISCVNGLQFQELDYNVIMAGLAYYSIYFKNT